MIVRLIVLSFVLLVANECRAETVGRLVQNRRSFVEFAEEAKISSYLSSFGANPTAAVTKRHEIIKRSSTKRKVRKSRKPVTTTETPIEVASEKPEAPEKSSKAKEHVKALVIKEKPKNFSLSAKNFSVSPRHMVKFELDDAKYSEEYEKLKKSRKLRNKRAAGDENPSNQTQELEKLKSKDSFVQPRELFRFSHEDAVIKPADAMKESERKIKREIADSTATETKKVHMTNPLRGSRSTKHVSYDDVSSKLQKIIDSALHDAVRRGKAHEGDYLKFFYGDKIIKVPVSMSKYVLHKPKENKEVYGKETPSFGTETTSTVYGKDSIVYGKTEDSAVEKPKLLGTKKTYYPLKTKFDFEDPISPIFVTTSTEKAKTFVNFETPIVVQPDSPQENNYLPYKSPVYYYKNDDNQYGKNSVSSPGPVLFDSTTPSNVGTPKPHHFKNFIFHPPTPVYDNQYEGKSFAKEAIPITEDVDESFSYIPLMPHKSHVPIPIPTSYVEYAGNHAGSYEYAKNYEFGYHVSDYKTGNNFGHVQKSTKEETKGEYSTLLPDGRVQTVKYYDDGSGFHADVSYQNVH